MQVRAGIVTVVCISLVNQHERRQYMRRQLTYCELPWRFFDAIQINQGEGEWPVIYDRRRRLRYNNKDLVRGEIGCYLSHRQVWAEFLAGDDEFCVVLEDDVEIGPDFKKVISTLCQSPEGWEFVRLFGVFPRKSYVNRHVVGHYSLVDYLAQPNGTQGYILNRKAAERLFKYTGRMWQAIDNAIDRDWEHGVRIMAIEPHVVFHQTEFETTITFQEKMPITILAKLRREFYRCKSGIEKQLWMCKKRLQLSKRDSKSPAPVKEEFNSPREEFESIPD